MASAGAPNFAMVCSASPTKPGSPVGLETPAPQKNTTFPLSRFSRRVIGNAGAVCGKAHNNTLSCLGGRCKSIKLVAAAYPRISGATSFVSFRKRGSERHRLYQCRNCPANSAADARPAVIFSANPLITRPNSIGTMVAYRKVIETPPQEIAMHIHANNWSSGHGWNKSPAHQARSLSSTDPGLNFGRTVSQIARGIYEPSGSEAPAVSTVDTGSSTTDSTTDGPLGDGSGSQSATSSGSGAASPSTEITSTVDVSV